jgi:hypothetical protein
MINDPANTGRMMSAAAPTVIGGISARYDFTVALTLTAATFAVAGGRNLSVT